MREVDYKNVGQLRRYTSDRGKIRSRRMSGACRPLNPLAPDSATRFGINVGVADPLPLENVKSVSGGAMCSPESVAQRG